MLASRLRAGKRIAGLFAVRPGRFLGELAVCDILDHAEADPVRLVVLRRGMDVDDPAVVGPAYLEFEIMGFSLRDQIRESLVE